MISTLSECLLLASIAWPLVIVGLLIPRRLRAVGQLLIPSAILPALALSAMPASTLHFAEVMLGGLLTLDAIGRVFLLLIATLWLSTILLAGERLRRADSCKTAILLLLAMAGSVTMIVAGDVLVFFAASTVTGYSLYGALVNKAGTETRKAGKVLVIFLVCSDLLVLEVLLMLGYASGAVDFESLRLAFVTSDNQNMLLGLLMLGFGSKLGMFGVHFWIPAVFSRGSVELRPAFVAFTLAAGALGGLRLLPRTPSETMEMTTIVLWLAWATLVYSGYCGIGRAKLRSNPGNVVIAISSIWLVLLSACLQQTALWMRAAAPAAAVLIQSGLALAVISLLYRNTQGVTSTTSPRQWYALKWAAVILLGFSPLSLVSSLSDPAHAITLLAGIAVITLLAANLVDAGLLEAAGKKGRDTHTPAVPVLQEAPRFYMVVTGLLVVTVLAHGYQLYLVPLRETATVLVIILLAISTAKLNKKWRRVRQQPNQPEVNPAFSTASLVWVRTWGGSFLAYCITRSAEIIKPGKYLVQGSTEKMKDLAGMLERELLRWSPALALLLGLLVVCLSVLK